MSTHSFNKCTPNLKSGNLQKQGGRKGKGGGVSKHFPFQGVGAPPPPPPPSQSFSLLLAKRRSYNLENSNSRRSTRSEHHLYPFPSWNARFNFLHATHSFSRFTFSDLSWIRQLLFNHSYLVVLLSGNFHFFFPENRNKHTFIQQVHT